MKKFLTLATIAMVALAIGATAHADVSSVTKLQRQVAWQERHIEKLNNRRDHLHKYIQHLRLEMHPRSTSSSSSGYSGGVLTASQVASYARAAGFPESAISTMVYYASRESGFDPGAINSSSGACGLWQLYPCYGGSAWLDPAVNAHYAYEKYQASGFAPWQ